MMNRLQLVSMTVAMAMVCACVLVKGQTAAQSQAVPKTTAAPAAPVMPPKEGSQEIDRIVAIVGGDLVLDSDVDEERRFSALQPFRGRNDFSRDRAIERLINRALILQQIKLQPQDPISDADVKKDLDALKKSIPDCKQYACETEAGWKSFLTANGFTEATLTERWRMRMEVLRFIEERFRMGVRISQADIKSYYDKTLLPEYEKTHTTAPTLDSISGRIQEVLLQQQVSNLLGDWLKSLRAQGSVVLLKQGEVAP